MDSSWEMRHEIAITLMSTTTAPMSGLCWPRNTSINQFTPHRSLAFEKWIRIGQINSKWSSADVYIVQVANSAQGGFMVC
jgi:hypothetical protein